MKETTSRVVLGTSEVETALPEREFAPRRNMVNRALAWVGMLAFMAVGIFGPLWLG